MNYQKEVNNMFNKKRLWSVLLVSCLLMVSAAHADSLQDFVLTKLDGKGTVDSIDLGSMSIVINDRSYQLSDNVTVFDVANRRNSSVENIKTGNSVGFKSRPLPNPTAPYDQLIVKIWILPNTN